MDAKRADISTHRRRYFHCSRQLRRLDRAFDKLEADRQATVGVAWGRPISAAQTPAWCSAPLPRANQRAERQSAGGICVAVWGCSVWGRVLLFQFLNYIIHKITPRFSGREHNFSTGMSKYISRQRHLKKYKHTKGKKQIKKINRLQRWTVSFLGEKQKLPTGFCI